MNMAKMILSKEFKVGKTDDRLFGSFVEHMGSTVYNGIFDPEHEKADESGFRIDVLDLVKKLNLSVIRYPGGNFVSGFNWEDSIGPVEKRPVRLDLAWKAVEPNTFGLNEFMNWMQKIPSEPIMTVNLGTRGINSARNLLEYCNFSSGSFYSDLRRSHGVDKPYGIKMWCLGNEMDGSWQIGAKTAHEYGRIAYETGKAMKSLDPDIELVAAGSSTIRMKGYPDWDKEVLMHTYDIADYISLHHYVDRCSRFAEIGDGPTLDTDGKIYLNTQEYLARTIYVEQQIKDIIAVCDYIQALKRSKKTMYLSFDEWNVVAAKKHSDLEYRNWKTGYPIDCGAHTMEDALAFASMMMAIIRRADRVKIACQSLLVNTGPLIVAKKDGIAWANAIFYPFMHISLYGRGIVLNCLTDSPEYETKEFGPVPVLDSLAVYNEEKGELSVFTVNRNSETQYLHIDLRDFGKVNVLEHITMRHKNLNAVNTENAPFEVTPHMESAVKVDGGHAESMLSPYSWNVIRFQCKGSQ
ncbi:MAG TPA: alpha-L-arabinofuranosidase C-terminal domain-containing protein [Clostridia bacterium]